ncbi:hypothetical protein BX666DRAFT_1927417 [Dichotomocladium elegans]|nr:hypothetical protein BX666DRAFT_1927417 [Dichotomocladium elegans]
MRYAMSTTFPLGRQGMASWLGVFFVALAVVPLFLGQANAQHVEIERTGFDNLPDKLFYFKDSEVVLWLDANQHMLWRSADQGKHWEQATDIPRDSATYLIEHPFDKEKAYVLSKGKTHWKTIDQGKTWQSFETSVEPAAYPQLSFHAERSNYVLFHGFRCERGGWTGMDCKDEMYYTLNNFEELTPLQNDATSCIWSLSSPEFENAPVREIMCVESIQKDGNTSPEDFHLVQSEDFFRTSQPVDFGAGRPVKGVIAVSAVNRFLVAAAKPSISDPQMDLYVSQDGENWHGAVFPEGAGLQEKAYTIVESTGHSLLVDVLTNPLSEMGALYKSNSNGTFFVKSLDYTNRNSLGIVDFERMQGVEGVMIANVVANHERATAGGKKDIQTRISFDDGSTWTSIQKVKDMDQNDIRCDSEDGECALHLHSVTSIHNAGQVFSSKAAVGVAMGVGHYGRSLLEYDECDTFLSTDGGLTWRMVREGAHKYEFGDMGGLLVMVDDEKEVDHVWWSKDRGGHWERLDLSVNIRARILTTDHASTSRSFLLIGSSRGSDSHTHSIHLDFSAVQPRQCELDEHDESKSDFEKWYARDLTDGPDCLMGHEQMFYRRKADRDCYVGRDFEEPASEMKECPCTEADYECDYNFIRGPDGKCERVGPDRLTGDLCSSKDGVYPASSGYRLIPGNTCNAELGKRLDEPVERPCSENLAPAPPGHSDGDYDSTRPGKAEPSNDDIKHYSTQFSDEVDQFIYFKDSPSILVRLRNGQVWFSEEHGIKWTRLLESDDVVHTIILHEFDNTRAYALTEKGMYVINSQDVTWKNIRVPLPPSRFVPQVLDFHPQERDWLLFIGDAQGTPRHSEAFISKDHGSSWGNLDMWVEKCIFGRDSKYDIQKETIYCAGYDAEQIGDYSKLFRTTDFGETKEQLFDRVVEFFVIEDFMAVASSSRNTDLILHVSVDGKNFAEAKFPPNHYIDRNTFTVLQSTTHAILLNIFKSVGAGKAHGTLYKSNDNGTYYHMALDNTNGDAHGFVDFEKMQGLEGIILANQVMNADELVGNRAVEKRVRTMISWDDGGQWQPLAAPKEFDCSSRDCTLNLHSRTDIHGPGAIFTATGAPGLAMGVGNVGPELLPYDQSDTWLTRDGGHSWSLIQHGEHLYEFGDHGSLLVLINDEGPTNELLYSWDQGETWHFYQFSDTPVRVNALTTDPMSTTLRFIILGHMREGQRAQVIVTVDFSETKQRKCEMSENEDSKNDFELWIAKDDEGEDACLLGQKLGYWRRKKDRVCKVGDAFKAPEIVKESCECRDIDFECDFGFWRNERGECEFYGRHPDRPSTCDKEFLGRSGYKKNPRSSCNGGINLEEQKQWTCGEAGEVLSTKTTFSDQVADYIYYTDTDRVVVRTVDGRVWGSEDDGFSWKELFPDTNVIAVYQHPKFDERAYFITDGLVHYATQDKGSNYEEMGVPLPPVMNLIGTVLNFHNLEADYLLYLGEKNCDSSMAFDCHSEAFYSHDNGRTWNSIGTYMRGCIWGHDGAVEKADHHAVLCEQYREHSGNQKSFFGNPVQFLYSSNYYKESQVLFDDVAGVAVFGKYIIVAAANSGGGSLRLLVSLDGKTFSPAHFPAGYDLPPEAFTIMESVNSMWIHVSTNTHRGSEFGHIFTSNSNGSYYVLSLENANRNEMGIVDFEKMQGIEGIAIANKVTNPGEANTGNPKKLTTVMTADAGGHWFPLPAPEKDSAGNKYDCAGSDQTACRLNLHCYSERKNVRDLFSLSSAVGLMVGVGNVGSNLAPYEQGNMFLTRDAGHTWHEIQKGSHIWEFADQGALLILVEDREPTNMIKYTTNEGLSWKTYQFANKNDRIQVSDIITQPDGTSQKYVIFGQEQGSGKTVAYHIDFSRLHPTKCNLDLNNPDTDDFELWSPEDTRGEKCLFGRETKYYRRIQDRDCYIGEKLVQPHSEVRNCTCTYEDFECDFNFVRNENNECVLVAGLEPVIPECDGTMEFYYYPTGYRKTAATSCVGGIALDEGDKYWCPGKSTSGGKVVLYVLAPILGAGLIYTCLQYRRSSHGGRIHLPDSSQMSTSRLVSHPVLAKVVAAAVVIPVALIGLLSRIPVPHSLSDLTDMLHSIPLPSWLSQRGRGYNPLSQDEHAADVLLDDYDGSEGQLLEDIEDDADEL